MPVAIEIPSTNDILKEMLTENTGSHFLDSGGAYGRHWEKNKTRDFDNEPEVTYNWDEWNSSLDVTRSLYHFLKTRVEYDHRINRIFQKFVRIDEIKHPDESWEETMNCFIDHLREITRKFNLRNFEVSVDGEYGSGYTYNDDNILDQDFVWNSVTIGDYYVFLRIHGGCDARGGFTAPVLFRTYDEYQTLYDYAKFTLGCTGKKDETNIPLPGIPVVIHTAPHMWDYQGGYWQAVETTQDWSDGSSDWVMPTDFEKCPTVDLRNEGVVGEWQQGVLLIDEEGVAHCPECGNKLEVWVD